MTSPDDKIRQHEVKSRHNRESMPAIARLSIDTVTKLHQN